MELVLKRIQYSYVSTIGMLYVDGRFFCYTLEDEEREIVGKPVKEWKLKTITAIPTGRYKVVLDYSPKYGRDMPHVLNVPGYEGIRIHSGNVAAHTEGCILVGANKGVDFIGESRPTFALLMDMLHKAKARKEEVTIQIVSTRLEQPIPESIKGKENGQVA